jgi:hypothetical protein
MTPLRHPVLGCAALLCAIGTTSCGNDVLDGNCTPDSPDITIDDDCPYQNALGPQIENPACETQQTGAGTSATWGDVFDIFIDTSRGNCSDNGCHGLEETAANGIYLPRGSQQQFYDNLAATTGSVGRPYINSKDRLESWVHCNVAGTPGGGLIMPKPAGMPSKADALIVEDWVFNGALGP